MIDRAVGSRWPEIPDVRQICRWIDEQIDRQTDRQSFISFQVALQIQDVWLKIYRYTLRNSQWNKEGIYTIQNKAY